MATRNVTLLRGKAVEVSGIASEAITPGMLVEFGGSDDYQAHSTGGGAAAPWFAREQHENQGAGIDDDIASGDEVTVIRPQLGASINAFTSDTIVKGESVESDGDGGVRVYGSGFRIGVAAADSDLSGTNGRVEIVIAPHGV